MRSNLIASLLALPLALAQEAVLTSTKRGLVYVKTENSADDHFWTSGSDITWYYNYMSEPTSQLNNKLEFVPMLWGSDNSFYNTVKGLKDGGMNISYVLAFNEPDGCGQVYGGSCIDAQTAAETWKSQIEPLKDFGIKLGGPAVTSAPTGFTWLQNFFTQCAGGCSVDFLPVHYYGDFQGLASHIGQVNVTYQNISAMWVTEYGFPNQNLSVAQDFYNQSSAFLNRVPYIQRYSYFGSFRSDVSNVGPNAAMLTQKGQLTDIGAWYLGEAATGNIPKGDAVQLAKFAGWTLLVVAVSFYRIA